MTESQLQANRDEVARVRSAWNVLSDPFQRQRYDAQLASDVGAGWRRRARRRRRRRDAGERRRAHGLAQAARASAAEERGGGSGNGNGNGKKPAQRTDRNGRPRPEPTVVLPAGMTIAEPRVRGMALLFDISILIVIFFTVSLVVPRLIQSDYQDIQDRISKTTDLKDARQSVIDAQKDVDGAKTASETKSAQSDLSDAQKDYRDAVKDAKDADVPARFLNTEDPPTTKQLQTYADKQSDEIKTTGYVTTGLTFVLALAYLVPMTRPEGSHAGHARSSHQGGAGRRVTGRLVPVVHALRIAHPARARDPVVRRDPRPRHGGVGLLRPQRSGHPRQARADPRGNDA